MALRAGLLKKSEYAGAIAAHLGLRQPRLSGGGTVVSTFLDDIAEALGLYVPAGADAHLKAQMVLEEVGSKFDERVHVSGGGTVTTEAYAKLHAAITGTHQWFILNTAGEAENEKYTDDLGRSYGFDEKVSGWRALRGAGEFGRVIFYRTSRSNMRPTQVFIGSAAVVHVSSAPNGVQRASLTDFQRFENPVPADSMAIAGWNHQISIVPISDQTADAILSQAGLSVAPEDPKSPPPPATLVAEDANVPSALLAANPPLLPAADPTEACPAVVPEVSFSDSPPGFQKSSSSSDRRRNARAEVRAVYIVRSIYGAHGWELVADRQKEGVGFDLEFARDGAVHHTEVKGISGGSLRFNMTWKEWERAVSDPDFVVAAVTRVLHEDSPQIHWLTRDRLLGARRSATQYRLEVGP